MLQDIERELLTAYVDGECSDKEQTKVRQLLKHSPEARKLLRRMQEDAQALRGLPKSRLSRDFSQSILNTIQEQGLRPRPIRSNLKPIPFWPSVAAAASVIFAIGLVTFFYIVSQQSQPNRDDPNSAHVNRDDSTLKKDDPKPDELPKRDEIEGPIKPDKDKPGLKDTPPKIHVVENKDKPKNPGKIDDHTNDPIITAPGSDPLKAAVADVVIPDLFYFHGLSKPLAQERFQKVLEKRQESGVYIELLARDAHQALARLKEAGQSKKITLILDQLAQARQKQGRWKTDYVVYLEELSAKEFVALLEQLRGVDAKAEQKRSRGAVLLDSEANVIVTTLNTEHRKRLTHLIGDNLEAVQPTTVPTPQSIKDIDPRKPLSHQTLASVQAALKQKKRREHSQGLALVYNQTLPRRSSNEVKQFLSQRVPTSKDALRVMLVIRQK